MARQWHIVCIDRPRWSLRGRLHGTDVLLEAVEVSTGERFTRSEVLDMLLIGGDNFFVSTGPDEPPVLVVVEYSDSGLAYLTTDPYASPTNYLQALPACSTGRPALEQHTETLVDVPHDSSDDTSN